MADSNLRRLDCNPIDQDDRVVLRRLFESMHTPMWREYLADEVGLEVSRVGRALDRLVGHGLAKRDAPRKNDDWAITPAGVYAWRLLKEWPDGH